MLVLPQLGLALAQLQWALAKIGSEAKPAKLKVNGFWPALAQKWLSCS